MFRIKDQNTADILRLPLGYIARDKEEEDKLKKSFNTHLEAEDDERFNQNILSYDTCVAGARIVTKTWNKNGKTLRRGTLVFIKPTNNLYREFMVCLSKSKTGQSLVWTCGKVEIDEYTALPSKCLAERGTNTHKWFFQPEGYYLREDHGASVTLLYGNRHCVCFNFENRKIEIEIEADTDRQLIEKANSTIFNFEEGWRPRNWE